jgi:RNA 3'-terminal phosphate cyclase
VEVPAHPTETIREQAQHLLDDFSREVKTEIDEIRHGEAPTHGGEADLFVRRHVMGLILIMFGLVALILLVGIAFVAFYGQHGTHMPGMF